MYNCITMAGNCQEIHEFFCAKIENIFFALTFPLLKAIILGNKNAMIRKLGPSMPRAREPAPPAESADSGAGPGTALEHPPKGWAEGAVIRQT